MNDQKLDDAIASLAREVAPDSDLWPGIESRLGERRGRSRRDTATVGVALAMAAAVVLYVQVSGPSDAPRIQESPAALTLSPPSPAANDRTASLAEAGVTERSTATEPPPLVAGHPWLADYEEAAGNLEAVFAAQRDDLEPMVVSVVDEHLEVVDGAIRRARAAFELDPHSPELLALVQDAYEDKLELLDRANGMSL